MTGEAIELATTGVDTAGDGTTVVGALVAVLLTGWFPVGCWWLEAAADELAPVLVVEVVVADAVADEATLVSGWLRFCCCCCCCSWRLR